MKSMLKLALVALLIGGPLTEKVVAHDAWPLVGTAVVAGASLVPAAGLVHKIVTSYKQWPLLTVGACTLGIAGLFGLNHVVGNTLLAKWVTGLVTRHPFAMVTGAAMFGAAATVLAHEAACRYNGDSCAWSE